MVDVFKNLVMPQKVAQQAPDNTDMIQMNQVFANPSKEEVTYPKIYPLTVKEIVGIYNACAKLKHFFKCNARNFKSVKTKAVHAIKTAHYTDATATACNSTPGTLVLRKMIKAEMYGKRMEQPSDPNQSHKSCQVNKRCT
jgi:hypothetical protein